MQSTHFTHIVVRSVLFGTLTILTLAACGGGGGGSRDDRVTPPVATDATYSISLDSITASDRSNGTAVTVTGDRVSGATATLQ